MTAYLGNTIFDDGLNALANAENLYLLSADPGLTYANIATYALGVKASPTVGSPADMDGGGRGVAVAAVTDGSGTATGTALYYALVDDSASDVLAVGELSVPLSVTNGGTFATQAGLIGIPDPASA